MYYGYIFVMVHSYTYVEWDFIIASVKLTTTRTEISTPVVRSEVNFTEFKNTLFTCCFTCGRRWIWLVEIPASLYRKTLYHNPISFIPWSCHRWHLGLSVAASHCSTSTDYFIGLCFIGTSFTDSVRLITIVATRNTEVAFLLLKFFFLRV